MRRFHIVATTRNVQEVLAVETAGGWLLPCLDDDPNVELPEQVQRLISRIVGTPRAADMIHEAPLAEHDDRADVLHAGITAAVSDVAVDHMRARGGRTRLHAVQDLLSTRALMPLQQRALAASIGRLRRPEAPFDSIDRVEAAFAWVDEQLTHATGSPSLAIVRHRCARYEYVAACESITGMMYFKGGRDRVTDEGVLTRLLWTLSPRQFPETVAVDDTHHRWLYRELPGELLVGDRLTRRTAIEAIEALARLQARARHVAAIAAHLADRRFDIAGLIRRVDSAIEHAIMKASAEANAETDDGRRRRKADGRGDAHGIARTSDQAAQRLRERWNALRHSLAPIAAVVDAQPVPLSLVLSDFWGRNVLKTADDIGFIDVEESCWSHPMLPLWRFIADVEARGTRWIDARAELQQAFVEAWSRGVPTDAMRQSLVYLPQLGRLFNVLLVSNGLEREARALGHALPAGYRVRRLSTFVERCMEEMEAAGPA